MYETPQLVTPLNAVVATTTSVAQACNGAKRITLFFTRADHVSGSSAFAVSVSIDDSTYVTYNKLIDNVVNSNAQQLTRVASSSALGSNTTKTYTMDLSQDVITSFKVTVTEVTDGTHTAKALISYI